MTFNETTKSTVKALDEDPEVGLIKVLIEGYQVDQMQLDEGSISTCCDADLKKNQGSSRTLCMYDDSDSSLQRSTSECSVAVSSTTLVKFNGEPSTEKQQPLHLPRQSSDAAALGFDSDSPESVSYFERNVVLPVLTDAQRTPNLQRNQQQDSISSSGGDRSQPGAYLVVGIGIQGDPELASPSPPDTPEEVLVEAELVEPSQELELAVASPYTDQKIHYVIGIILLLIFIVIGAVLAGILTRSSRNLDTLNAAFESQKAFPESLQYGTPSLDLGRKLALEVHVPCQHLEVSWLLAALPTQQLRMSAQFEFSKLWR
ncbi:expressed unknown protein [Seminavis robusta]|uniref:Uncharacterized protein n=1 Tax=Seminavis robusta TaxID=568900 RepID=A0A9N8HTR7_9STRA|nr:expressed unknown protein [Seminavis robusta]|eukprot:Sro1305_g261210.1 n/a (316) ;mRNA; r:26540-27487